MEGARVHMMAGSERMQTSGIITLQSCHRSTCRSLQKTVIVLGSHSGSDGGCIYPSPPHPLPVSGEYRVNSACISDQGPFDSISQYLVGSG